MALLEPLDFRTQLRVLFRQFTDQCNQFFPAEFSEGRFGGQTLAPLPPV
jgi:hypothetical protein